MLRFLVYLTPLYLYVLETILRTLAGVKTESVAGPTIAAAGIGFLIPLFKLKRPVNLNPKLRKQIEEFNLEVYSKADKSLSELALFSLGLSLGAWMYSLYLVIKPLPQIPYAAGYSIALGSIIFVWSVYLSEKKERV